MSRSPSSDTLTLGKTETQSIDRIRPYWRNPRNVPEEAIDALVTSIKEFGYQQPLVVDEQGVLIVGHTRYAALRRLGVKDVPVIVADGLTAQEVKQYRLVDNRVGEYSTWDHEKLEQEWTSMERSLLDDFFPEFSDAEVVDVLAEETELLSQQWEEVDDSVEFICPDCYHEFQVTVTRDDVMNGVLK